MRTERCCFLLCLLVCLLLTGCSGAGEAAAASPPAVTAAAAPEPAPEPASEPVYTILGREYPASAAEVELTGMREEDAAELAAVLGKMPALGTIRIGSETGTPLSWETLKTLRDAAPGAAIDYAFTLFGKSFNLSDEELDLKYIPMDDEGALVGRVAACMSRLKKIDMDSCRVPNEAMARLRDSLPGVEVIWRINFAQGYTARTDETRILASMPGQAGELVHNNVENLKYCTKVKYLDLGHNNYLDTLEFIRSMPELEVLIAALSNIEDFSPVADCPKLEYVEAFTTRLHDLTPFAELHNLRHLNICYDFAITDITPLYGLELERLWIGMHDPVPPAQIEEFRRLHPNCVVNDTTPDPTEEYWRFAEHGDAMGNQAYDPRYELLRRQMRYSDEAYSFYWTDPLYDWTCPREVTPDPEVKDFQDLY